MTRKKGEATVRVKWTDRKAILLERGPNVSLIKWKEAGTEQAIPNDQLEFVNEN